MAPVDVHLTRKFDRQITTMHTLIGLSVVKPLLGFLTVLYQITFGG